MTSASTTILHAGPNVVKGFEFTKRKRWADLLVTELADGINFVLSVSCTVLYCGPAIAELIGWRDVDLIDRDLLELIIPEDQATFRASFEESIQRNSRLLTYTRFRCSESFSSHPENAKEDVLFEVKGYPHSYEIEGKCFFATAKPYPSRNTEMLNTFLELKMENEQLQRRLLELRNHSPLLPAVTPHQIYTTSPTHSQRIPSASLISSQGNVESLSSYYSYPSTLDTALPNSIDNNLYGEGPTSATSTVGPLTADDEGEEGSKKKKLKKTHLGEQYVCITCGRTNSPEWRKGPLGPKTLCNACGLRWAKQVRKIDESSGEGAGDNSTTS